MSGKKYPNLQETGRGGQGRDRNAQWWLGETDGDVARMVSASAGRIWNDARPQREAMLQSARLYGLTNLGGLTPRSYRATKGPARTNQLSLNVVKAVTDSYVAMLTEDRPKVTFLTSGGDRKLQKKAQTLETFVDGVFYETDLYETDQLIALDSALFPFGVTKTFVEDDSHVIERVFPWEIGWDDAQAIYGKPPETYQFKYVDRRWLQSRFPKQARELETAAHEWSIEPSSVFEAGANMVMVVEAWHLGDDGMHVIVCGNVLLMRESYRRDCTPFELLYRQQPIIGMYGMSLAEELRGIQREINIILQKIQRSYHLLAAGHWLVEDGSHINTGSIDNIIGSIIRYRGTPPEMITASGVPADVYQQLDRLYGKAFELIGVPQTFAEGQKPADLSSGKALETYADIASKRFQPSYRNYQAFHLRLARQVIATAEEYPDLIVRAPSKDFMRTVKAGDALLKDNQYVMQLFPTNKLADDPAERLAQVQNMANAGWIPQEAAMRLLDFPDLKTFAADQNASYELVSDMAERLLDGEPYEGPEPFMNLQEAVNIMQRAYLTAKRGGSKPKELLPLLRWLRQAAEQIKAATPPPAPAAPPMQPPQPVPAPQAA